MRFILFALFLFTTILSFSQTGVDKLLQTPDSLFTLDSTNINSNYKIDGLNSSMDINQRMEYLLSKKDSLSKNKNAKFVEGDTSKVLSNPILNADNRKLKTDSLTDALKAKTPDYKINVIGTDGLNENIKGAIPEVDFKQEVLDAKSNLLSNKDSLLSKNKEKIKSFDFAKQFKYQLRQIKPKGSISVGYEYGVLPFVAGDKYPSGGFKTEGNVSFLLAGVPLELMYYYTDIKNVIGLNNYFRLSFDTDRYKEQLGQKVDGKKQLAKGQLSKLQLQQQQMMQKMEYLNLLKQNPNYQMNGLSSFQGPSSNSFSGNFPKDSLPGLVDTSGMMHNISSSNMPYAIADTSKLTDSLNSIYDYKGKKDSVAGEYSYYKSKYDSINELVVKTQMQIKQIESVSNNPESLGSPYLSKIQNFLGSIKKFEIGLCTPSYSTFLVNNVPLQGVNIELTKNDNFLAFTYGTTINNLFYNTNTLQGTIQGARNLYNYFDFGNLEAGRKIICLKGGFGAQDNTHLYAGILIGKGRADYLYPVLDESTISKESNLVVELDGKYKFSEQLSVDVILGKSSLNEGDLTSQQISKAFNEIFSNYRSYAALVRANLSIKKTSTKITYTTRWIDPYFKSFGIGFLRSDNLRYEVKVEQAITRKIKYTVSYRREEDNLLKLYDYKNTLQSINNMLNLKINRQINIRLIYAPLFRELKSGATIIKDQNNISTAILSYTPKMKKGDVVFNALYSKYIISGDSMDINFENFTFTDQFQFKSGFNTGLNVSWFKNNLKDTLNNDTYLGVVDVGFKSKKGHSFTVGGKAAYKSTLEIQYGFVAKINIKIYRGLYWEAQAEKILVGDYYNSFITEQIEKFPYYCNSRLVLNF